MQARIQQLGDEWDNLVSKTSEKSDKLKEANQQHNYISAAKDLEFWISEVYYVVIPIRMVVYFLFC